METVNGVVVVGAGDAKAAAAEAAAAAKKHAASGLSTISYNGTSPPLDFSFQDIASMSGESEGSACKPLSKHPLLPAELTSSAYVSVWHCFRAVLS